MRKLTAVFTAVCLMLSLIPCAGADYDPHIDYYDILLRAAANGDIEAGRAAEICRNEIIDKTHSKEPKISFEDLFLLAKIVYVEAGAEWIGMEHKMCVAEVVLNRVASPEFPNTVREVIYQEGQYEDPGSDYFEYYVTPGEECVEAALRVLLGERHLSKYVVYQSNFTQGGGVYAVYYDSYLGATYFCSTSHPEKYW